MYKARVITTSSQLEVLEDLRPRRSGPPADLLGNWMVQMTEAGSTSKASGTGRGRDGSVRVGGWVQGSESGSIEGINLSLEQASLMAPLKYLPPTSRSPSLHTGRLAN